MIVKPVGDEFWITGQPEHARVSGVFAAAWGNAGWSRPDPVVPVVLGTIHHDDGWLPYEAAPRVHPETGQPCNFRGSPFGIGQIPDHAGAIAWLSGIDPYAGLLVNMHRCGLPQQRYGRLSAPDPGARRALPPEETAFLQKHEGARDRLLAGLDAAQVWTNYHLLQVWDLLSLYLCEREPGAQRIGPVPAGYGTGGEAGFLDLAPRGQAAIAVSPYPFDRAPLRVPVALRRLPRRSFRSDAEFREAYFGCPEEVVEFRFEP